MIDQTELTDQSLRVAYLDYNPSITINSFDMYPTNEGEISTYFLSLKSSKVLPGGSQMQFIFPKTFGQTLSTYDKGLVCTTSDGPVSCTASGGKLTLPLAHSLPVG